MTQKKNPTAGNGGARRPGGWSGNEYTAASDKLCAQCRTGLKLASSIDFGLCLSCRLHREVTAA